MPEEEQVKEEAAAQPQKFPEAVCPYCGLAPLALNMNTFKAGNITAMVSHCVRCHKVVPVHIISIEQPQIALPGDLIPRGRG